LNRHNVDAPLAFVVSSLLEKTFLRVNYTLVTRPCQAQSRPLACHLGVIGYEMVRISPFITKEEAILLPFSTRAPAATKESIIIESWPITQSASTMEP